MAAWLAYLKSCLLLPKDPEAEPSPEELALRLQLRLQRLDAMREAGRAADGARPGRARRLPARRAGGAEGGAQGAWQAGLYDLIAAYGSGAGAQRAGGAHRRAPAGDDARRGAGAARADGRRAVEWTRLEAFLPATQDPEYRKSALASSFVAALELARLGKVELAPGRGVRAADRAGAREGAGRPARAVEAVLFAAEEPLSAATSRRHVGRERGRRGGAGGSSQAHYAGRGIELVERGGPGTSRPRPIWRHLLRREREESRKLSRAAVETLAIIAYHEPVSRAEIEAIRGVQISKGTLDVLMEAGWVRPAGRREAPGRPLTFATTATFLSHFGLPAGATCRASTTSRPPACSTRSTRRWERAEAEAERRSEPGLESDDEDA
jgi:segregation and condensation protein B